MTADVEAVLFDYGGVMTGPVRDSIAAWQAADGIDPASFTSALRAWLSRDVDWVTPVHRLETGELSVAEFEEVLADELRSLDGAPVQAAGLLGRIFAAMRPDPEMFTLVEELRAAGVKVGLLSNSWGNTYPRERIDALFDAVVISGEVGLRKPQPEIFRHALDLIGAPAERTVFVDDAEPNVLGAQAVGIRGLIHRDPLSTRAELSALVRLD